MQSKNFFWQKNISTKYFEPKIFFDQNFFFNQQKSLDQKNYQTNFFLTKKLFRPKNSCTQTIYSSYVTVSLCWFGLISLMHKKTKLKKILSGMGGCLQERFHKERSAVLALYFLRPYCVHCTPALCSWSLHEHAHEALMSICAHESFMSMLMKLSRARAREGVTRTTTIGQYASWLGGDGWICPSHETGLRNMKARGWGRQGYEGF